MAAGPDEMRGYGERLGSSASELGPALRCIICRLVRALLRAPAAHPRGEEGGGSFIENLIVCLVSLFLK